jgi:hypothetical protein
VGSLRGHRVLAVGPLGPWPPVVSCLKREARHLVERLAKALGVKVAELLPQEDNPKTVEVLREQARVLFEQLVKRGDRETLALLNPLMAKLVEGCREGSEWNGKAGVTAPRNGYA